MNRILNATKLDFYAAKSTLKMTAALTIIAIVIGMISHGPDYTMMFTMVFGVTASGGIFSIYERNHSEKLYGILPLKKSEMIIGRYLYALIIGAAYIVFAAILGAVMSKVMSDNMTALTYWATLGLGFAYFSFATGIAYPIYLKFTFAKAYVFTMIPMYIIAVLFLIVTRRTDIVSNLTKVVNFFTNHVILAPIFGLLAGLLLLTVSALIANLIYTRKEI